MDKQRKIGVVRGSCTVAMVIFGVWILALTVEFPPWKEGLTTLVNKPDFVVETLNYTMSNTPEPEYSPLTGWVIGRWGLLPEDVSTQKGETPPETPEKLPETEEIPQWEPPKPMITEDPDHNLTTEGIEGHWIPYTVIGTEGQNYMGNEGIFVANRGKVVVEPEDLAVFSSLTLEMEQEEPQILIYHSHATESYSQIPGYTYQESDPYRTLDASQNILMVGQAMAEVLTQAGFSVIHDKTLHDYPDYNSSYQNSAQTLGDYLEKYPSISLVLDVHRDALSAQDATPYQLISQENGGEIAQVMLVVGSNGDGYSHDFWRENFALAVTIQQNLIQYGDFARPIALRSGRFNQHLSTGALLVEIGGHGNTLPQAIAAGELLAKSIADTLTPH